MSRLGQLTLAMSRLAGWCIFAIIAVTMYDVLSNNLFRRPFRGTFELVELLLVMVVFLGLPELFRRQLHIVVDVIDHFVSETTRARLILTGALVTLAFLLVLGYAMISPALDTLRFPERRQDTGIRTTVFWLPILIGTASCIVATALDAWERIATSRAGGPG